MLINLESHVIAANVELDGGKKMRCEILKIKGDWTSVLNACRTTVGKSEVGSVPTLEWRHKILLSEHSPIRLIHVQAKFYDIPYWVSVHLLRHTTGVHYPDFEPFIQTQRTDRTGIERDNLPQGQCVNMEFEANAAAIINMSRKRLCGCAAKETRDAWKMFLEALREYMPEIVDVCVPECIYRGFCPEIYSCSYHTTLQFAKDLTEYRSLIV